MNWNYRLTDLKIKDNKGYCLFELTVTADEIRTQLSNMTYTALPEDDNTRFYALPNIKLPFYQFILFRNRLPTEAELYSAFYSFYLTESSILKKKDKAKNLSIEVVKHRINRAYPVLVRSFHFYRMLEEKGGFDSVVYSIRDDEAGTNDIEIISGIRHYMVKCFDETESPDVWYKSNTVSLPLNSYPIAFCSTLTKETADVVGDFMLFKNEHLNSIKAGITLNGVLS